VTVEQRLEFVLLGYVLAKPDAVSHLEFDELIDHATAIVEGNGRAVWELFGVTFGAEQKDGAKLLDALREAKRRCKAERRMKRGTEELRAAVTFDRESFRDRLLTLAKELEE
jgi:hypothetical protein